MTRLTTYPPIINGVHTSDLKEVLKNHIKENSYIGKFNGIPEYLECYEMACQDLREDRK